jgi:hypothetical protein
MAIVGMLEVDMDILDKLKLMAELPVGSMIPKEICPDGGINPWDVVISALCRDAAKEIEQLRSRFQPSLWVQKAT